MGCLCTNSDDKSTEIPINQPTSHITDSKSSNIPNQYSQSSSPSNSNTKTLQKITLIQSFLRGFLLRKKFFQLNPFHNYKIFTTSQITDADINSLFRKYPPLNDGVPSSLHPRIQYPNNIIYYGEMSNKDKTRHGRGIQIWPDGSRYEGYWQSDKANIKGKLIHSDGDVYEGEWLNSNAHGYGEYTHLNGSVYKGYWENDKQNGKGVETWIEGDLYEGDFKDGKKSGKGKFKWKDGSSYEGEFKDNMINGKGVYKWVDMRQYSGYWKENKMDGEGVFIWPDGRKYEGGYKEDKKHGYGIFEWKDGKKYRGYWSNGKQHGEGEMYNPNKNEWRKRYWEYGKKVKRENDSNPEDIKDVND